MKKRSPLIRLAQQVCLCGLLMMIFPLLTNCFGSDTPTSKFIYPEYSKTISMDFKEAALMDVMKVFSQQSGMNFIASEEISAKKITLYLDKVPVEQALEQILSANNLTYEIQPDSDIFIIKAIDRPSKRLLTRVYSLKYATVKSSKLNDTISIAKIKDKDDDDTASSSTQSSATASQDIGITAALKAILTEFGKVIEDPRTNSLIVSDIPSNFAVIEQTIARLDILTPQVLIETEMLDISKETSDKLGVKIGDTPLTFTGGQRAHVYPWNQNRLLNKGYIFEDGEYFSGLIDASGLSATLQFLRTQTDTKYLARPKILTLNNETAQIKISTDEAIGTATETQGSEGITNQSVQAERVETGVFLNVTPQVNLTTRSITMAIAPKVIEAREGQTFLGVTFKDPEERGTKSILRVRDGDTIILGGLLRSDNANTRTKVPILGEIPIIGSAFRHKDKSGTERELVVFITPHIIDETENPHQLALTTPQKLEREQKRSSAPEDSKRKREVERALKLIESQRQ